MDRRAQLLREHWLNREDYLLARVGEQGKVETIAVPEGTVGNLLEAHVTGQEITFLALRRGNTEELTDRIILGAYPLSRRSTCRWICLGVRRADDESGVADPWGAASRIVASAAALGLHPYLEWADDPAEAFRVWIFFDDPVDGTTARRLALQVVPEAVSLADGTRADAARNRGIVIHPKITSLSHGAFGSATWLPFRASEDAIGQFLEIKVPFPPAPQGLSISIPECIEKASLDLARALAQPEPSRKADQRTPSVRVRRGIQALREWIPEALQRLPLEEVYNDVLTDRQVGSWMLAHNRLSENGSMPVTGGISDGSGRISRGTFCCFESTRIWNIFEYQVAVGAWESLWDAARHVAILANYPLPERTAPAKICERILSSDSLPATLDVENRQLAELAEETKEYLATYSGRQLTRFGEPCLFRREDGLVRVDWDAEPPKLRQAKSSDIRGAICRVVRCVRTMKTGTKEASPPEELIQDILTYRGERLPWLDSIVHAPVFSADGTLVIEPGYYAGERMLYVPIGGFLMPEVPESPTDEDIERARALLLDYFLADFPFEEEADRTHMLIAMLQPWVRRMIDGSSPFHLIESGTHATGKTLLCNLISIICTGKRASVQTLPRDDDRAETMFASVLRTGQPLIFFDNQENLKMQGSSFASVMTAHFWESRLLHTNEMIHLRNEANWYVTSVNPRLSREIARRSARVRLKSYGSERSEIDISRYKEPDIEDYARRNRSALVSALITLVKAWIVRGKPRVTNPVLATFEQWSGILGGIVEVAGCKGFLRNREELYADEDIARGEWDDFITIWARAYGSEHKLCSELVRLADDNGMLINILRSRHRQGRSVSLGRELLKLRGQVIGDHYVHYHRETGRSYYSLSVAKPESASDELPQIFQDT